MSDIVENLRQRGENRARPDGEAGMILDFTNGKNGWGHAIHGSTMTPQKGRTIAERLSDWWTDTVRCSFLIHHPGDVYRAERMMWTSNRGTVNARIYRVEHTGNVDDMWKVYVSIRPEDRG